MKKKLTRKEAALLRWKYERWLMRPDTAIKLYHRMNEAAKNWKTSNVVSEKYYKLIKDYYKSLYYKAKTKKAKELYKSIIREKGYRFKAYANQNDEKLQSQQVFTSYHYNNTEKIWDRLEYLKTLYPYEYFALRIQPDVSNNDILERLKNKAIMEGRLKPLAQGEEWGYIDEEQGLVWSGD